MIGQKLVTEIKELAAVIKAGEKYRGYYSVGDYSVFLLTFFMESKSNPLRVSKGAKVIELNLSVVSNYCEKELTIILLWGTGLPIAATEMDRDDNVVENVEQFGITKYEALSFISNALINKHPSNYHRIDNLKKYI